MSGEGYLSGFGSRAYRAYVINALLVVYILNFIDRSLLSVVAPQMKPELRMSDTAFGLLTGFGFALLYTIVGIPLAQLSETRHRVGIMTACIALWSLMTALCGLATDLVFGGLAIGGFWILLICRIGVGIGEAGCTPPANSLISDYFPPSRRSTALGYYAMGVTLGGLFANLIGGAITEAFGWRVAFFSIGFPGVLVAAIFYLTVKEPPRGYSDPPGMVRTERPRLSEGLKELAGKRSFWMTTTAATIAAFCAYGLTSFQSLFINRSFGLSAGEAALFINVPVSAASALGTVVTGWLAGRLTERSPNAIVLIPGFGLVLSAPCYVLAFTTNHLWLCLAALCAAGFFKYGYLVAQYAVAQGVVSIRVRAVSTAILLFVVNLLGYGFGPLFIGGLSDILFGIQVARLGAPDLVREICEASTAPLDLNTRRICEVAHPRSLQQSMLATSVLFVLAGGFLLLAARFLQNDLTTK